MRIGNDREKCHRQNVVIGALALQLTRRVKEITLQEIAQPAQAPADVDNSMIRDEANTVGIVETVAIFMRHRKIKMPGRSFPRPGIA